MWRQIVELVRSWILGECLHGPARGAASFAVDVGLSYLSGKLVDDLLEEGIKAAAAGITSKTAASIGRYFNPGLVTRHRQRDRNSLTTHQLMRPQAGKVRIQALSSCAATFQ